MKNKFKLHAPIAALALYVFAVGYTFAENKVVVIPMGGGGITDEEFQSQFMWVGRVYSNIKAGTGLFDVEHTGTGYYKVNLNIDNISVSSYAVPTVSLFGINTGFVRVSSVGTSSSGGDITGIYFRVRTYDTTYTAADRNFSFHAKHQDPNPLTPAASQSVGMSALSEGEVCETVGEVTTCTIGEAE